MSILQKQRQHVTGLQVSAESEREEKPPWRFKNIRVLYRFTGHDLRAERIERAIELTEMKYCSVGATLREAIEIQSEYKIVEGRIGMLSHLQCIDPRAVKDPDPTGQL